MPAGRRTRDPGRPHSRAAACGHLAAVRCRVNDRLAVRDGAGQRRDLEPAEGSRRLRPSVSAVAREAQPVRTGVQAGGVTACEQIVAGASLCLAPGGAAVCGAVVALHGRDEQHVLGMSGDGDGVRAAHLLFLVVDPCPARAGVGAAIDAGPVRSRPPCARRDVDKPRRLRIEGDVGDHRYSRLRHSDGLPGYACVVALIQVARRDEVTRIAGGQQVAGLERVGLHGPDPPGRRRPIRDEPQVVPGVASVRAYVNAILARRVHTIGVGRVGAHDIHDGELAGHLFVAPGAGAVEAAIDAGRVPEGSKDPQRVAAGDVQRAARHAGETPVRRRPVLPAVGALLHAVSAVPYVGDLRVGRIEEQGTDACHRDAGGRPIGPTVGGVKPRNVYGKGPRKGDGCPSDVQWGLVLPAGEGSVAALEDLVGAIGDDPYLAGTVRVIGELLVEAEAAEALALEVGDLAPAGAPVARVIDPRLLGHQHHL